MSKQRTQIQLEPLERQALEVHARRRGISMSQAAREAIRLALGLERDDAELRSRFLAAAGVGKEPDARRNIARKHDEILYGDHR